MTVRRRAIRTAVAAAFALGALPGCADAGGPTFHGTPYHDTRPAPDLLLTDHRGQPFRLSNLRGRAVLLFFGFTHCPDVCPATLDKLSRVSLALGERVAVVMVTVDPERDTPGVLGRYLQNFGPNVTGVTRPGSLEVLYREYGVYAGRAPGHGGHGAGRDALAHTSAVYGFNRDGKLRVVIPPEATREEVTHDARLLLGSG
ncbi:MAG: SCO family protein [Longimicrobiaceae bacterium]